MVLVAVDDMLVKRWLRWKRKSKDVGGGTGWRMQLGGVGITRGTCGGNDVVIFLCSFISWCGAMCVCVSRRWCERVCRYGRCD